MPLRVSQAIPIDRARGVDELGLDICNSRVRGDGVKLIGLAGPGEDVERPDDVEA